MADVQVGCINKSTPDGGHEHITHLGNTQANWKWTRAQVIESIDAKTNTFFVIDPKDGKRADVLVVRLVGRSAYVHTYADGDFNDNLLSLPSCP